MPLATPKYPHLARVRARRAAAFSQTTKRADNLAAFASIEASDRKRMLAIRVSFPSIPPSVVAEMVKTRSEADISRELIARHAKSPRRSASALPRQRTPLFSSPSVKTSSEVDISRGTGDESLQRTALFSSPSPSAPRVRCTPTQLSFGSPRSGPSPTQLFFDEEGRVHPGAEEDLYDYLAQRKESARTRTHASPTASPIGRSQGLVSGNAEAEARAKSAMTVEALGLLGIRPSIATAITAGDSIAMLLEDRATQVGCGAASLDLAKKLGSGVAAFLMEGVPPEGVQETKELCVLNTHHCLSLPPPRPPAPQLEKKISCSHARLTPAVSLKELRRRACRRAVTVTVKRAGLLGIELGCMFVAKHDRVVIDVVRVVPGELMQELGIKAGDWLEEVGHINIDLMNISDTNDDGKLSELELTSLVEQIRDLAPMAEEDGVAVPTAHELMERYDVDKSTFIEPRELVELVNGQLLGTITRIVADTPRPVEIVFSRLDPAAANTGGARGRELLVSPPPPIPPAAQAWLSHQSAIGGASNQHAPPQPPLSPRLPPPPSVPPTLLDRLARRRSSIVAPVSSMLPLGDQAAALSSISLGAVWRSLFECDTIVVKAAGPAAAAAKTQTTTRHSKRKAMMARTVNFEEFAVAVHEAAAATAGHDPDLDLLEALFHCATLAAAEDMPESSGVAAQSKPSLTSPRSTKDPVKFLQDLLSADADAHTILAALRDSQGRDLPRKSRRENTSTAGVTRSAFASALVAVVVQNSKARTPSHIITAANGAASALFDLLDESSAGVLALPQLLGCITTLAKSSPAESCELVFSLFDVDRSGDISISELEAYFVAEFRFHFNTMKSSKDNVHDNVHVSSSPEKMAKVMAESVFQEHAKTMHSSHGSAALNHADFTRWFMSSHAATESVKTPSSKMTEQQEVLSSKSLCAAFSVIFVQDIRQVEETIFRAFDSDENGMLSFEEMHRYLEISLAMILLISDENAHAKDAKSTTLARAITEEAFETMDSDKSGEVSANEFGVWIRDLRSSHAGGGGGSSGVPRRPPMSAKPAAPHQPQTYAMRSRTKNEIEEKALLSVHTGRSKQMLAQMEALL